MAIESLNGLPSIATYTGPTLEELGIVIHGEDERLDTQKGMPLTYTTVEGAIEQWIDDPHGETMFRGVSETYAISRDQLPAVLEEAGMGALLDAKREGRFVTMVSTQVTKPTYYFMSNVLMAGELAKQGLPTAVMMFEYPTDTFFSGNGDKRGAFKAEMPVAIRERADGTEIETVEIILRPWGIRHDDGSIQYIPNMTIDDANGYRCDQVLVQAVDARDPNKKEYGETTLHTTNDGKKAGRVVKTHYQGALGMTIPGLVDTRVIDAKGYEIRMETTPDEVISLTDFYHTLWDTVVDNLRTQGYLPSAEEMPMFWIDMEKAYSTIAKYAGRNEDVLKTLEFSTSPYDKLTNLFQFQDDEIRIMGQLLQVKKQAAKHRLSLDVDIDDLLHRTMNGDLRAATGKTARQRYDTLHRELKSIRNVIRWAESRDIPVSHLEVLHHVLEAKDLYFDPKNGLLMHKKGMMDAGSYYPVQTVWPDLYLECSSCGTYWFVGRLHRAEAVRHQLGLPDTEVRIPDREIPALEAYVVGPGRYADRSDLDRERGAKTSALAKDIQRLKQEAEKKITSGASDEEREARDRARIELEKAKAELEEKKISFHRDTIRAVIEGVDMTEEEGSIYRQYDLVIPKEIHAYWASLLANTGDALERAREQVNNLPLKAVVYTEQVRNGIPPTSI